MVRETSQLGQSPETVRGETPSGQQRPGGGPGPDALPRGAGRVGEPARRGGKEVPRVLRRQPAEGGSAGRRSRLGAPPVGVHGALRERHPQGVPGRRVLPRYPGDTRRAVRGGAALHRHGPGPARHGTDRDGGGVVPEGVRRYGRRADVGGTGGDDTVQVGAGAQADVESYVVAAAAVGAAAGGGLAEDTAGPLSSVEPPRGCAHVAEVRGVVQEKWISGRLLVKYYLFGMLACEPGIPGLVLGFYKKHFNI